MKTKKGLLNHIRKSGILKYWCYTLVFNMLLGVVIPFTTVSLTGGPSQPEFSSFTPVGVSDMVDLSSGDMNYNIPLMDVGGYPINISYNSGVGADDEASWVGLGWNLSAGQINRNVRGIPDDFNQDLIQYENYLKPNVTVGAKLKITPHIAGVTIGGVPPNPPTTPANFSVGLTAVVNNYTGYSLSPSFSQSIGITDALSIGFNVESSPDGLCVSPSISLNHEYEDKKGINNKLNATVGTSFSSRAGLSELSIGASMKRKGKIKATEPGKKDKYVNSNNSIGSKISFNDQLYTPSTRIGMTTKSFTVNAAVGSELFLGEAQGQITAYGTVTSVRESEQDKLVKSYGYNNTQNAGSAAILDFNREKDGAVSVNTTNLPLTNYTYDIYSVQGQGVSGNYRPYRNKVGYVYDPYVQDVSVSGTLGAEFGAGNAVHVGTDFDVVIASGYSGNWSDNNSNRLQTKLNGSGASSPDYESVHYKNVGDLSADKEWHLFTNSGAYDAIRGDIVGSKFNRRAENRYRYKVSGNAMASFPVNGPIKRYTRHLRNQAIYHLTVAQLGNGIGYGPLATEEEDFYPNAKPHHINEIQIIRNDGARYVYGLPVYNEKKREATFAVVGNTISAATGLVGYLPSILSSPESLPNDKYFNRVTTPAYVHTHLLTSVLSTDYSDLDGDGPTVDDLGSYTKFNYEAHNGLYKWRIPVEANTASFNEGLSTDPKDDQGNYIYGEKELVFIDKIETKTHVAKFYTSARKDALGVYSEAGGVDPSQTTLKLDSIALWSIEEYDDITPGTPIKKVHFEYSYSLCPDVPNNLGGTLNDNEISNKGGKLTLKKIYFTYRDSRMGKYTGYRFNYNEYTDGLDEYSGSTEVLNKPGAGGTGENPVYSLRGYDSWGNYKPNDGQPGFNSTTMPHEFPYTEQDSTVQSINAAVWCLKRIELPSGGRIQIQYESDDYASVQDKATMRMFKVRGAGITQTVGSMSNINTLYDLAYPKVHNNYLYAEIDDTEDDGLSSAQIESRYFPSGSDLVQFRFLLNMNNQGGASSATNIKSDYVSGYFQLDRSQTFDIFVLSGKKYLSIPIKKVDMESASFHQVNPIAKAGWQFGRKYLNRFVFDLPGTDDTDIMSNVNNLVGIQTINNLIEIFKGPNKVLEGKKIARRFSPEKSWVRLLEPDKTKLGGGCRVKEVKISDVWSQMNSGASGYITMQYGQNYNYKLKESAVSSGVATFEPSGNKENPWVQPVFSTVKHLLAPNEENYMEGPFGESFFPSPEVTYSRVEVNSTSNGVGPASTHRKHLTKTGKVVTEFYTTKDFPTIVDQTRIDPYEDHTNTFTNILKLTEKKFFTASQGYVIHLNDMNGKQKAQWVYAEGQIDPISGVEYKYRTRESSGQGSTAVNKGRLNNRVKVINPNGAIEMKEIGVEYDIVNDFRENSTTTRSISVNANVGSFVLPLPIPPIVVPIPLPDMNTSIDQFRSVSTTKVINTFGLLEETIAHDAGASVSTKNLAWDALTGEVLLTETVDEYHDTYYTLNYPAHWHYSGMGPSSMNLGFRGSLVASGGGYTMTNANSYLIPGDEMYLTAGGGTFAWVNAVNSSSFTLIDEDGDPITSATGSFEVIRSGHRNLQSAGVMNVTLMRNPLKNTAGNDYQVIPLNFLVASSWDDWRIINAGAVDYSDRWRVGCECEIDALEDGTYNPYRINEKGVWRTKSSRTYLTGRNKQADLTPRQEGFFTSFSPMYKRTYTGHWVKNFNNWTYVAEVSSYSPYGFELENRDALGRYSAAQYGYNHTFPMAVGANTAYRQIGFDGFEDYDFDGCSVNNHFSFRDGTVAPTIDDDHAHTGRHSIEVGTSSTFTLIKNLDCDRETEPEP